MSTSGQFFMSADNRSRQPVKGRVVGLLNDWLDDRKIRRRNLRAAGAGRSGRTDISERIEELLAEEVKK
jgi:hypothetical protein